MLFLLNDRIIDVDAPEARLARRWKTLGCGDPHSLMARDALEFSRAVIDSHKAEGMTMDADLSQDLAALIISKTGANAALFLPSNLGSSEPRLTLLPEGILSRLQDRVEEEGRVDVNDIWPIAA